MAQEESNIPKLIKDNKNKNFTFIIMLLLVKHMF